MSVDILTIGNVNYNNNSDIIGLISTTIFPNETNKRSSIDEFPQDFMTDNVRNHGGIIVHVLILTYCCLSLAIVCDVYFIKTLDFISRALGLPPDVAGATFMAVGTSAPELFTSIIGVFISQDDIGTGTIVGSAMFNLIAIPGVCGFASYFNHKSPSVSKLPILRDSIFYVLTVVTLILCIKDNFVDWVESLSLLVLYGIYLVIMYFNARYSHLINKDDEEVNDSSSRQHISIELTNSQSTINEGEVKEKRLKQIVDGNDDDDDDGDEWMDSCFIKYPLLPTILLFKITLPKPSKRCFVITFIMCIVWVGLFTYVSVWMVTIIGFTIGIPETLSGITILAAGSSIPELISSYILVKKTGLADMAICNSIGSNIFDILFCLGVPWLLKSLTLIATNGIKASNLANTSVHIQSSALPLTSFILLLSIFAMLATFKFTKWKLGLRVAIIFSIIYIAFIAFSTLLEIFVY